MVDVSTEGAKDDSPGRRLGLIKKSEMAIKPCKGRMMVCKDLGYELIDEMCGIDGEVFRPFWALGRVGVWDTRACSPGWDGTRIQRWGVSLRGC